jgi:hypothetical protein
MTEFGFVFTEYVITQCKLEVGSPQLMQFEQSMKNLCTDARKKLKNQKDPAPQDA